MSNTKGHKIVVKGGNVTSSYIIEVDGKPLACDNFKVELSSDSYLPKVTIEVLIDELSIEMDGVQPKLFGHDIPFSEWEF